MARNPFHSGTRRPEMPDPAPVQPSPDGRPAKRAWSGPFLRIVFLALVGGVAVLGVRLWTTMQLLDTQDRIALTQQQLTSRWIALARQTARDRDQTAGALQRSQGELQRLTTDRKQLDAEVRRLQEEQRSATEAHRRLEDEMRHALQSRDVTISELAGKLTVNILDRVLFPSGEANITEEGQQVLKKVAEVLGQFPERQIQVIGHTDNVPIRTARFPSNWELSAARATAAVRFLTEQAAVDPRRLGALGYGEFHPIAENTTAEGRAKNRRIAIVILPELIPLPNDSPAATVPAPAGSDVTQPSGNGQ